ncbi:hypothetical protein M885DRAFT_494215 [Pelagophyceae sp. CCMP2097]|nr:hypothetical protein M885DRAFT_494215 [Pelagophyceae sp. CCMP2097]
MRASAAARAVAGAAPGAALAAAAAAAMRANAAAPPVAGAAAPGAAAPGAAAPGAAFAAFAAAAMRANAAAAAFAGAGSAEPGAAFAKLDDEVQSCGIAARNAVGEDSGLFSHARSVGGTSDPPVVGLVQTTTGGLETDVNPTFSSFGFLSRDLGKVALARRRAARTGARGARRMAPGPPLDVVADFVEPAAAALAGPAAEAGPKRVEPTAAAAAPKEPAAAAAAPKEPAAAAAAPKEPGAAAPKKKRRASRPKLDDDVMRRLQQKLQAATFGKSPLDLFKKFAGGDGELDATELIKMCRVLLRIPADQLSDVDVRNFVAAVDDDGSKTLSIAELADFVQHGTSTFYADAGATAAKAGDAPALAWGERAIEAAAATEARKARRKKQLRPDFDHEVMKRLQGRLQAATFGGSPAAIFAKFDSSGDGAFSADELTVLFRRHLRIPPADLSDNDIVAFVRAVDDDGTGTLDLQELADFVQYGMATFYADAEATAANAPKASRFGGAGWGERAAEAPAATAARRSRRKKLAKLDAAVVSKLQARLKAACEGRVPLDVFRKFSGDDDELDLHELTKLIRKELRITEDELDSIHIRALMRAVDDADGATLSVHELADFMERGMAAFSPVLPAADYLDAGGADDSTLGRILGALQARLGGDVRKAHKASDGAVTAAFCRDVLCLAAEDLSDVDVDRLTGFVKRSKSDRLHLFKLALLLKRGARTFDPAEVGYAVVVKVAAETRARVVKATIRRKLEAIEAKRLVRATVPRPGKPISPAPSDVVFGWLAEADPAFAPPACGADGTRAVLTDATHIAALLKLRSALVAHESMGRGLAAAACLAAMARALGDLPLHRYHRGGAHRALQLGRAADALAASHALLEADLGAQHFACAKARLAAAQAYVRAADAINVDAAIDDAEVLKATPASAQRAAHLAAATKQLRQLEGLLKGRNPPDARTNAEAQLLLGVCLARRGLAPGRYVETFDRALSLLAKAGADAHALGRARRDYAHCLRDSGDGRALAELRTAEALLFEPPPDPQTVEPTAADGAAIAATPTAAAPPPTAAAPPPTAAAPPPTAAAPPPPPTTDAIECRRTRILWELEAPTVKKRP